jgi:hypothetical protein
MFGASIRLKDAQPQGHGKAMPVRPIREISTLDSRVLEFAP